MIAEEEKMRKTRDNDGKKLLTFTMEKLLHNLLAEFKNENYDCNRILRLYLKL